MMRLLMGAVLTAYNETDIFMTEKIHKMEKPIYSRREYQKYY